MDSAFELHVNGQTHRIEADPETTLLEILHNDLGLTGVKYGCGEGQCGACTVLIGDHAVRSCVTPVSEVGTDAITTIEGLSANGQLHALQRAFLDEGAMQCGYCVAGMIMSAAALLREKPHPTDEEIVGHMNGNICRCGGYPRMLAAIRRAAGGGG